MACRAKNPYLFVLVPLLVACGTTSSTKTHETSLANHEQSLREHEAMIDVIEDECQKNRRNELTTGPGVPSSAAVELTDVPYEPCWKAADRREFEAHENAAAMHRSAIRKAQVQACLGTAHGDQLACALPPPENLAH
jgi:hypothetical protein